VRLLNAAQANADPSHLADGSPEPAQREGEWRMATLTAMAFNLFETIGFVRPCIEVMVREATECPVELKPLHMQWVRERRFDGRTATRIQWV